MEWETKKGWVSKEEGVERDKKGVSEQVRKNWMDASARKRYCPPRPTPSNPHQVHSIASGCNCPDLLDATHSRRHSGKRSEKNGSELGDNWEARFQGSKVSGTMRWNGEEGCVEVGTASDNPTAFCNGKPDKPVTGRRDGFSLFGMVWGDATTPFGAWPPMASTADGSGGTCK